MARTRHSRVVKRCSSTSSCPSSPVTGGRIMKHKGCSGSSSWSVGDRETERVWKEVMTHSHMSDLCPDIREEQFDTYDDVVAEVELESQEYFDAHSQPLDKGKGRLVDVQEEIEEVEDKAFPIMELPTEIRLEIYRACLTRPYKLMLSKPEKDKSQFGQSDDAKQNIIASDIEDGSDGNEVTEITAAAFRQARVARNRITTPSNSDLSQALPPRRLLQVQRPSAWASRSSSLPSSDITFSQIPNPVANDSASPSSSRPPVFNTTNAIAVHRTSPSRSNRRIQRPSPPPQDNKPKSEDPLIINLLCTSKQIYKEARDVLYSENVFDIDISTAVNTMKDFHQRSRRHIKHIELEIPTYTEILERFSEIVRLSLRYCSGLKTFVIHTPFTLPGAEGNAMASSNVTVYANGFDILRWLPQQCRVVLKGNHNAEIEAVVNKHLHLAKTQDKLAYARRQLISNEAERPLGT